MKKQILIVASSALFGSLLGCGEISVEDSETPTTSCEEQEAPEGTGSISACCYPKAAVCSVGTGTQTFEALEEGQGVTMIHGPQGGWHVWVSTKVQNTRDVASINVQVIADSSGAVISSSNQGYGLLTDESETCGYYYPGITAVLDVQELVQGDADTPPELLSGETATIEVSVTDTDGKLATCSASVTLEPDPADLEEETEVEAEETETAAPKY